jgi:CheY-like chemotaxis protein
VEDDAALREVIATDLHDSGHQVTTACDGADALEQLRARSNELLPDVILLDRMMPNMGGQLFRFRQLAYARLAAIPTLIMTSWPLDRSGRMRLGGVRVIQAFRAARSPRRAAGGNRTNQVPMRRTTAAGRVVKASPSRALCACSSRPGRRTRIEGGSHIGDLRTRAAENGRCNTPMLLRSSIAPP